jgi:CRP/FNR family cyclic AMP-dependent transcriptional regulator
MTGASANRFPTLQRTILFSELSEQELNYIAERTVVRHFEAGQLVFSEGEACPGLWIIETGKVRIYKSSPSGREQVLAIEGPGSSVAELPVFDGGRYPASAASVNDAKLLFISKEDFQSLCLKHPEVALKVLRTVGRRLRGLVGIIEELSFTTVRHRLISLLARMAKEGNRTNEGVEITLAANQQELAAQMGTVRELISRNLSRLQAEDLIRVEGRKIVILDLPALQEAMQDQE